MPVSTAVLREFVRKVYRDGGDTAETRTTYLDGLADAAMTALQTGRGLVSSSGNGVTAGYEYFKDWAPQTILELINEARSLVSAADADTAVASLASVRHFSTDFRGIVK